MGPAQTEMKLPRGEKSVQVASLTTILLCPARFSFPCGTSKLRIVSVGPLKKSPCMNNVHEKAAIFRAPGNL